MTRWKIVLVGALLPLAIAAALILSATATTGLATRSGVTTSIAWATPLMLEIVSLVGTLLWVLVRRRSLRRDAIAVTLAASAVALVAGLAAYGLFGLIAPCALVATVHLASRAWREDWDDDAQPATSEPPTVADLVAADAAPAGPPEPQHQLPAVPGVDDATVAAAAALLARDPATGRPRLIAELLVTDHQARKLLTALRPVQAVAS